MAKTGSESKYPNRAGKTSDVQTQCEMNVNAQPNNMIDNRIENPPDPGLLIRQASELAIRMPPEPCFPPTSTLNPCVGCPFSSATAGTRPMSCVSG